MPAQNHPDIVVSAPGRLCLLGEHQDYLGLSIIAGAIDLRITVSGRRRSRKHMQILLPDTDEKEEFPLDREIPYSKKRDYLKSGVNILQREGIRFPTGWECRIQGNIPINSGTASSSAMVIAWLKFLLEAAEEPRARKPEVIAELGFQAEVAEFHEPGGKMDHYASALGGVIFIDFHPPAKVKPLPNPLKTFVLADSLVRKDTTGTLGNIKGRVLEGLTEAQKKIPDFHLRTAAGPKAEAAVAALPPKLGRYLEGTLQTRGLTAEGRTLFESPAFDHHHFGRLLNRQYRVQRDKLRISNPKMDGMIETALKAGALGAKINGSGEGGCMFAYAPEKPEKIAEALKKTGAEAYVLKIGEGARLEHRD